MRDQIHNPIPSPGLASAQLLWGGQHPTFALSPFLSEVFLLETLLSLLSLCSFWPFQSCLSVFTSSTSQ